MTASVTDRRQTGDAYLYRLTGLTPYADALALMRNLAAARSQGAIPDTVITCQHPPVVTLGVSTDAQADDVDRLQLARLGIDVVQCDRGGRATYHGPGQLVCYPIVDLRERGRDLGGYVRLLEATLVASLADLGVSAQAHSDAGQVGVFTADQGKIASIGIHVARWITSHGFSLNVDGDTRPFRLFCACGVRGQQFTTVAAETRRAVSVEQAESVVTDRLAEALGITLAGVAA